MAPSLTYVDWLRFQRHVTIPMALGGSVAPNRRFWPRLVRSQAAAATLQFLRGMRKKYGSRAWSLTPCASTLVVLDREGFDEVLQSEANFADPFVKKLAVSRFTPRGVIVSRDDAWAARRKPNDHALAFGERLHPDADRFIAIVGDEVQQLLHARPESLGWNDFGDLAARISQQVIFGRGQFRPEFARQLGRLVAASNYFFRRRTDFDAVFARLDEQLRGHVDAESAPKCLVHRIAGSLPARADPDDVDPASQMAFWVFVLKDALELHTVRALALILNASPDVQRRLHEEIRCCSASTAADVDKLSFLEACIREELRLWTAVPILLRVAVHDFELRDKTRIRVGQQVLMHTGFYHRDTEVFGATADRFSPDVRSGPPLYVFSAYRQACAGQFLAVLLLKAMLAALLKKAAFALIDQPIDVESVPASIDHFALRFWRR